MLRFILRVIGFLFLLIGIIGVLAPIPFGLIFLILSMFCLIPTTPGTAKIVKKLRRKSTRIDRTMTNVTAKLPYPYRRILRETEIKDIYS